MVEGSVVGTMSLSSSRASLSSASLSSIMRGRHETVGSALTPQSKPVPRKRAKKPVDAPRRPKSAYMFFLAEFREAWKVREMLCHQT